MTSHERLKLAVAVAHAVPGTELRLTTHGGDSIVVSRHPAADIDPCAMRRVVIACARPSNPDLSAHITELSLGGGAADLGGGVFGTRTDDCEERWIPTLLSPCVVSAVLDDVGSDEVPPEAMSATLKPDADLGVTLLVVRSSQSRFDLALDAVAASAAAACFVEELTRSAAMSQQAAGGHS